MLVLTRKYQEKVRIGDGITITILRTKGKAVRLGIEAPPEVPVIRGELTFHESSPSLLDEAQDGAQDGRPSRPKRSGTNGARAAQPQPESRVSLHRVPREKAVDILPNLFAGSAPLRQQLQQRSHAN